MTMGAFMRNLMVILALIAWSNVHGLTPYEVQDLPLQRSEAATGVWSALHVVPIRADTKAVISTIHVPFGQHVEAGQLLYTLESPELELEIERAKIDYQQAQEAYQSILDWENSATWLHAKHDLDLAKLNLEIKQRQVANTRKLYQMGGLPQDTLTQEELNLERLAQQWMQAQSAFARAQKQGDKLATQKAALQMQQAKLELERLQASHAQLQVKAPVSGMLYTPDTLHQVDFQPLWVGQAIETHQWLAIVADDSQFGVVLELDSDQMDSLEQAQSITVNVKGIQRVASIESVLPHTHAQFKVKLALDRPETIPARLGQPVTATWGIDEGVAPSIPIKALHWRDGQAMVQKRQGNTWDWAGVQVGYVSQTHAQIRQGLAQGDIIGIED